MNMQPGPFPPGVEVQRIDEFHHTEEEVEEYFGKATARAQEVYDAAPEDARSGDLYLHTWQRAFEAYSSKHIRFEPRVSDITVPQIAPAPLQ